VTSLLDALTPSPAAVLVCVRLPGTAEGEAESSLRELHRLVRTLGFRVIATMVQARGNLNGPTVVGEGKLAELGRLTGGSGQVPSPVKRKLTKAALRREEARDDEEPEEPQPASGTESAREKAQVVVFDCELTPSQTQKLEGATGARVLDRAGVIIEIFSTHARTRAAKLQVEVARLKYVAPRLRETGGASERQGGGIGGKGTGESKVELDRRKIRDRLKELREELEGIGDEDSQRRERRHDEHTVALVGYTNAGKSSLMRALTGSDVLVEDKLFATLDTTVRELKPVARPRILVGDTVGFIKKLPHDLIASFRSTLEEARHGSLLLQVVDASDDDFRSQLATTHSVLAEIGAGEVPLLLVLNKCDRLPDAARRALAREFPDAIQMSALAPTDVAALHDRLVSHFEEGMVDCTLLVPWAAGGATGEVRSTVRVLDETYRDDGLELKIRTAPETLKRLCKNHGLEMPRRTSRPRARA